MTLAQTPHQAVKRRVTLVGIMPIGVNAVAIRVMHIMVVAGHTERHAAVVSVAVSV
jgi:hypothetical protein